MNVSAGMASRICSSAWRPSGREAQPDARVVETEDPGQDLRREACGDGPRRLARPDRRRAPRTRRASPARGTAGGAAGRSPRGTGRTAAGATARTRTPRRAARGRCRAGATSRAAHCGGPPASASRCSGRRSANTPRLSMAARDAALRRTAGGEHRRLELLSEGGGQGAHGWPQMITVLPALRCDCTSARSWSKYAVGSSPGLKVADGGFTSTLSGSSFLAAR